MFPHEHSLSGRKVVFDLALGGRENMDAHGPIMRKALDGMQVLELHDMTELLMTEGVPVDAIDAVIWRCVALVLRFLSCVLIVVL